MKRHESWANCVGVPVADVTIALSLLGLSPASAQTTCNSVGPDLIIADLQGASNYASLNGIEAFSVGHRVCNIGSQPAGMVATTNDHPVYGKSLFKLTSGYADGSTRFEQLGQSWLLHGFYALSDAFCCTDCQPSDGTTIGVHCGDSNTAAGCGTQSSVGPRWQVNPVTGAFAYPPADPPYSGTVARRLQAHISELTPSGQNSNYFVEGTVISADDATAGNGRNNASYRPATLTGSADVWNLTVAGSTVRELPAIYAWAAADPNVALTTVDVPGDGRFVVAGRANPVPGSIGIWHYEYAFYNLNSTRAARAFSVSLAANVVALNPGFHDVDYHSGDGPGDENFDGADWTFFSDSGPGHARWETQTVDENPSANALRWGTLYNFRLNAQAPPVSGSVLFDLFSAGTPADGEAANLPVPGLRTGDTNGDGIADLNDLANLLAAFGSCTGDAGFDAFSDFDRDGCVTLSDLALMLSVFGQ